MLEFISNLIPDFAYYFLDKMLLKKTITIELDKIPETDEDMCLAVAQFCAEKNLTYEFEKRSHPLIAIIDGRKYEITKRFVKYYRVNMWVLRCEEID